MEALKLENPENALEEIMIIVASSRRMLGGVSDIGTIATSSNWKL